MLEGDAMSTHGQDGVLGGAMREGILQALELVIRCFGQRDGLDFGADTGPTVCWASY